MEQVNSSTSKTGQSLHTSVGLDRAASDRVHEKTLLGAIDSYMSTLVHVRPYLAHGYRQVLSDLAERWLDAEGANALNALHVDWLTRYLAEDARRGPAVRDFYAWAGREDLLEASSSQARS